MARRRRSRKATPQQELLFIVGLLIVVGGGVILTRLSAQAREYLAICIISVVLIVGILFVNYLQRKSFKQSQALRALELAQIDTMSGVEFEQYLAALFRFQGYKVTATPRSGDFGVDFIIQKDGIKTAVQAKRYSGTVSLKAIQEVVSGMKMKQYGAVQAMVVTNSTYRQSAYDLAAAHNCLLIDRTTLGEWIIAFQTTE